MKKNLLKVLSTSSVLLLAATITSCSYSDFSIAGFFYKNWDNKRTEELQTSTSNNPSNSSSITPSDSSSTNVENTNAPQIYYTETKDGDKTTYDLLALLNQKTYTLIKYVTTEASSTYAYTMRGEYTREANNVTISLAPSVYADRTGATVAYINGEAAADREASFKKVYGDSKTFALNSNGSFVNGGASDSSSILTGRSDMKAYYYESTSGRPTYKLAVLDDKNNVFLNSFALHSTNHEQAVSTLIGISTYSKVESGSDKYETIVFDEDFRGYMYAKNGATDMEFDLRAKGSFGSWYLMSFAQYYAINITDGGYTNSYGDVINPYSFEENDKVKTDDKPDPADPEEPTVNAIVKLEGDANKALQFTINDDNTAEFTFTTYNATVIGKWEYYTAGQFVFSGSATKQDGTSVDFENVCAKQEDGSMLLDIDVGTGMTQKFTVSAEEWAKIEAKLTATGIAKLKGDANQALQFTIKDDGKAEFVFTTYNAKVDGNWTYESGTFTFKGSATKQDGTSVDFENVCAKQADGSMLLDIDVGTGMTQKFTVSAEEWAKIEVVLQSNVISKLLGDANQALQFTIKKDGSAEFTFTTYNATVAGTWEYYTTGKFVFSGSATKQDGTKVTFENVCEKQEDGSMLLDIDVGTGMTQKFTVSAEDWAKIEAKLTATGIAKLKGDANQALQFTIKEDGSASFTFTTYNATVNGTWEYYKGTQEFIYKGTAKKQDGTSVDFENVCAKQADGSIVLDIDVGTGMTQKFTVSAADWAKIEAKLTSAGIAKLKGDANKALQFTIKEDGTANFTFTTYNATVTGKWEYYTVNEQFIFSGSATKQDGTKVTFENVCEKQADGSMLLNIDVGTGMTQKFTISAADWAKIEAALPNKSVTLLKGDANQAFQFKINDDNTANFTFTTYNATVTGKWEYYTKGQFVFSGSATKQDGTTVTFENVCDKQADGSIILDIDVGTGMTQKFTVSAADWAKIEAKLTSVGVCKLKGDANKDLQFTIKEDGTANFTFTTYNATVTGKWEYYTINDQFVFSGSATKQDGTKVTFENVCDKQADGSMVLDINVGTGMTQKFTVSAAEWAKIEAALPNKTITLLKGDANKDLQFTIKEDGTANFTFTTYNATVKGSWTYVGGTFTFKGSATKQDGTKVTFENVCDKQADGSIVLDIDVGTGMTQKFTVSAADWAKIEALLTK